MKTLFMLGLLLPTALASVLTFGPVEGPVDEVARERIMSVQERVTQNREQIAMNTRAINLIATGQQAFEVKISAGLWLIAALLTVMMAQFGWLVRQSYLQKRGTK